MLAKGKWFFLAESFLVILMVSVLMQPAVGEDFKIIDTAGLKAMKDANEQFVLIDARSKEEYDEAHIVTAVNIPEKKFEESMDLLPADKNTPLVVYCNGVKCGKSKRLAAKMSPLGYLNIMIYSEGIPVWEERNLPIAAGPKYGKKIETTKLKPDQLKSLVDAAKDDYVLVDVRDESEYKEGHIPTAINIPAETFASRSEILPKEKKIVVYCNTGSRSYMSYRKLMKMDYKNIYQSLFADWKEAGLQIEK